MRIGIDVGGTFTDFFALNEDTGAIEVSKTPSTPDNPAIAVASGLRNLAQRHHILAQQPALPSPWIQASQDRCPSGCTFGIVIKLSETHTLFRQSIKTRRLHLTTITAYITPPHVITHDEDDIWPWSLDGL